MLTVTRYLWPIVAVVALIGLKYPILGVIMPLMMIGTILTAVARGRWICGNLCPFGSIMDNLLNKFSRSRKIPAVLDSSTLRIGILLAMMVVMGARILSANGSFTTMTSTFVIMYIAITSVVITMGLLYRPRAWCKVCPMGTLGMSIGAITNARTEDVPGCRGCKSCSIDCPMSLSLPEPGHECIWCGNCKTGCRVYG